MRAKKQDYRPAVAPFESILGHLAQVIDVAFAGRRCEDREMSLREVDIDVAAISNLLAAGDGVLDVGECLVHLVGGPDEELIGVNLHPILVVAHRLGVDAEEDVVGPVTRHARRGEPVPCFNRLPMRALGVDLVFEPAGGAS